ncbi:mhkB [Symbiodinium natans]|uniref:MhkB protein n=1 Tax=Symbiodinium natans TaxID=878477 RepID=A0A812TFJ5_9DINO|nr:mhkB [Symbiodinium natans]
MCNVQGAQQLYYSHGAGLVYAGIGKQIVAHSAATGQPRNTYEGHAGPVTCLMVAFCPHLQCDVLLSGSVDSTIKCWPLRPSLGPRRRSPRTFVGHTGAVWGLAVSSTSLFSCSSDCTIRQWCRKTCQELTVLRGHAGPVQQLLILESVLCSGSEDGIVKIWGRDSGRLLCSLKDHEDGITCMLTMSPEDIVTGSRDCTIKHWKVKSGKLTGTMYGHTDWVTCLLEVEDSLWSGSRDATIKRWHPVTHQLLATLHGHCSGVSILCAMSDSILSGSADRTITQWHPKLQTALASIDGKCGVSSLVEVPAGIFRLAARGPPKLLAKPRHPDLDAEPAESCEICKPKEVEEYVYDAPPVACDEALGLRGMVHWMAATIHSEDF